MQCTIYRFQETRIYTIESCSLNTANHKIRYALAHKEVKIDRFVDINANELMNNENCLFRFIQL